MAKCTRGQQPFQFGKNKKVFCAPYIMTDTTTCSTSNNGEISGKVSKKACILYLINVSKTDLHSLPGLNVRLSQ